MAWISPADIFSARQARNRKNLSQIELDKYKTKVFARFARKERINDRELIEAIERAEQGLIDAALGGGLIKQRVARPGSGRSGGYRAVIALRTKERAIFIHGFAKNDQANIGPNDGKLYKIKTRMR